MQACPRGRAIADARAALRAGFFGAVYARFHMHVRAAFALPGCNRNRGNGSSSGPADLMAASRGALRTEGIMSARAAFYVCYPGTAQADRIVTVPEREHAIGVTLFELCRKLRDPGRPQLQAECIRARAALRDGASLEDLIEGARARGLLRDEASLAPRGGIACEPPALSPPRDAPALAGAADA